MRPHQALEYKENYPNNILVESDMAENGKYAAICYRLKDGSIYRTMGTTAYVFDTAQEAINEMHEAITEYIKEFSTNTEEQPMDAQAKDWQHANDMVKLWSGCIEFDKRMITSLREQLKTQKKQLELDKKRLAEAIKYKEIIKGVCYDTTQEKH